MGVIPAAVEAVEAAAPFVEAGAEAVGADAAAGAVLAFGRKEIISLLSFLVSKLGPKQGLAGVRTLKKLGVGSKVVRAKTLRVALTKTFVKNGLSEEQAAAFARKAVARVRLGSTRAQAFARAAGAAGTVAGRTLNANKGTIGFLGAGALTSGLLNRGSSGAGDAGITSLQGSRAVGNRILENNFINKADVAGAGAAATAPLNASLDRLGGTFSPAELQGVNEIIAGRSRQLAQIQQPQQPPSFAELLALFQALG